VAFSDDADLERERATFESTGKALVRKVLDFLPLDSAADQLAAAFLQQRLPPICQVSASLAGLGWTSRILLRGQSIARLVIEEEMAVVYHCLANERRMHARAAVSAADVAGRLDFDLDLAPAIEALLLRVPAVGQGVVLCKLFPDQDSEHLEVAKKLCDVGIIRVAPSCDP
jgi:hypothetical protein